jgi:hypothetical protein
MAVDLRSVTTFQRFSLVLMDDCLIKLEHERMQDRVRRFSYDAIQNVVIWQKISWWRFIVCGVCLVLPGIGILFVGNTPSTIIGSILIIIGALLMAWYLYCKVTTIRIVRGGTNHDLKGLFRPGKLRRFRERLINSIQTAQSMIQSEGTATFEANPRER